MATLPTVSIDETSPAGSDALNLGDNKIREFKTQNRELMEVDHVYPSSGQSSTGGYHKAVHLTAAADIGTGVAGLPIVGAQTVAGKGELVYTDVDNNDVQITSVGKINAPALGGVYPAASISVLATILPFIYPIGMIIELNVSTNPNTLFGFGTWAAYGTGRVTVAIDAGQTEFDVVDETGGAKTHTLSTAEMPAHTHTYSISGAAGSGSSGGDVGSGGTTGSTGGGGAHNNLQPYIVVYRWRRTA